MFFKKLENKIYQRLEEKIQKRLEVIEKELNREIHDYTKAARARQDETIEFTKKHASHIESYLEGFNKLLETKLK